MLTYTYTLTLTLDCRTLTVSVFQRSFSSVSNLHCSGANDNGGEW